MAHHLRVPITRGWVLQPQIPNLIWKMTLLKTFSLLSRGTNWWPLKRSSPMPSIFCRAFLPFPLLLNIFPSNWARLRAFLSQLFRPSFEINPIGGFGVKKDKVSGSAYVGSFFLPPLYFSSSKVAHQCMCELSLILLTTSWRQYQTLQVQIWYVVLLSTYRSPS